MNNKCKTCKQRLPQEQDIAPCFCDKEAYVEYINTGEICVKCTDEETYCWSGPVLKTEAGAIEAWNSVMSIMRAKINKQNGEQNGEQNG